MGSPANSSSLITSNHEIRCKLLPLSACSQLLLLRLSPRLMPMLSMATMAMDTISDMPTVDTTMARDLLMLSQRLRLMLTLCMDTTDMLTTDTTMARDLLMLSQRPRLMPMLSTDTTDMPTTHTPMDTITDTLTMVTMDTHTDMPTGVKMCSRIEDY